LAFALHLIGLPTIRRTTSAIVLSASAVGLLSPRSETCALRRALTGPPSPRSR
jgi:hypothetical protein